MRYALLTFAVMSFVSLACDDGGGVDPVECVPVSTELCATVCDPLGEATGVRSCSMDKTWGSCVPPSEICGNDRDDDCDTDVDEGCGGGGDGDCVPGASGICEVINGDCKAFGMQTCKNNETWGNCYPPEEICNEEDDDCNGAVDDVPGGCGAGPQPAGQRST